MSSVVFGVGSIILPLVDRRDMNGAYLCILACMQSMCSVERMTYRMTIIGCVLLFVGLLFVWFTIVVFAYYRYLRDKLVAATSLPIAQELAKS